ncbi:MAG: universal stress protein [Solirubrobacteraceae bacterium]
MSAPIIVGLALREDDAAPLALAQTLSGIDASPLVLAHAIRPDLPGPIPIAEYQEVVHRERSQKLAEVASRLPRDLQVSTRVTDGSPSHVIQSLVTEFGAVAAVVGSTTRGAMGRVLAGDTAAGLLHDTACPVAVAPRGYRAGAIATIGVAYDASPESENALTAAVGIPLETGAAIRVLTVLEPSHLMPDYEQRRREAAQATTDRALGSIPHGVRATAVVTEGGVVEALATSASGLDLLVCGSRGYGPVHAVASGSVARGLSHRCACPLVIVPRGVPLEAGPFWSAGAAAQVG